MTKRGRPLLPLLVLLLGLTVPASGPAAAPPERIAVEAFAALPTFSNPRISPDGKRIVAIAISGEEKTIVSYEIDADDNRMSRINLGEKLDVVDLRWAGNRRILLTVFGPVMTMGVQIPVTRLYVQDLDTRKLSPVGGQRVGGLFGGQIIFVAGDGSYVLLAAQPTIWESPAALRVDLDTMKSRQVVASHPGVWTWYADATGTVRAGLGSDARSWWLYYREQEGKGFRRIAKIKRAEDETLLNLETLLPVAGSDKGYAIANKATGRYGVYNYDFRTDTIGEPLFEHKEVDIDGVGYSERTGAVDSVFYADDRDRIHWLDAEMAAVQKRLDKALPATVNKVVSRDAADNRMVVWSTGGSEPGVYYLYDRAKRALSEIARPHDKLDGKALAPVESVRYAARDGLSIPAYLTRPPGAGDKGLPLVVMPHGGPFMRDKWAYDAWVQFLANRGYVVLQPNFRGSTGYGKAFVEAANGQFGRKMQDDLDDGVKWLAGRGLVDPKRVCIMGASYGGYAAMWAAARNPDIYRCAISFAGISEIRPMLRFDGSGWIARRYYRDWRDRIRGDEGFDLDSVSPLSRAAAIRVPLLIAHGEKDGTVPPAQSKKLHDAMRRAKIDHEFVLYPEAGHGFGKDADSVDFLKRAEAFLAKHNPPD
jgi:dipeptidyl aminopeptidase/acylaminoacyl peptidase